MDQAFITAPAYPPAVLLTGIIVNKLGKRFVTEDSYHSRTSGFVMDQPRCRRLSHRRRGPSAAPEFPLIKFIDGWETVAEMEAALGIPAGNLAATLDRYNEFAAQGEDPDFHKQPEFLAAQDNGPWAAFDLSLGKAMYSGFTVGGLADVDGRTLRDDGSPVPGLYAAGACASIWLRTAKGIPAERSWGRGRSSADAPAHTRRRASGVAHTRRRSRRRPVAARPVPSRRPRAA